MIEPDFLSVPQLAKHWGQAPQQIIVHGLALRLPILFLFDGVAIAQSERMQSLEAEFLERRELERKTESVRGREDRIRRNAVGPADKFSRMNSDDVIELRREINVSKERINQLNELIDQREQKRLESRYTGTMRALPQTLLEIWQDGETAFPYWAMHPLSEIHLTEHNGRQHWDGMILHLEPGISGKWKRRITLDDLLVPMTSIKALEAKRSQSSETQSPKKKRGDLLSQTINSAQNECQNQFDANAVWPILAGMAKNKCSPLLGVSEDGIKWSDSNDCTRFLTLKNLRDRLKRQSSQGLDKDS